MNKNAMAVAVAGVLAAPATFAQSSNVQLYGRAVLGLDYYSATGARDVQTTGGTAATSTGANCTTPTGTGGCLSGSQMDMKGRLRVFDNGSRVGLRGTEDLGNNLKAIFQIETGVNIDSGSQNGQNGTSNASTGFWASRDSFVGLDSSWGRLTFGRQSTFWVNGVNAQFSSNYINTEIPWTNGTQLGRVSSGTTGSIARYSNNVQYITPTFAGMNLTVSYSPNNQEAVQNSTTTKADGDMWGGTWRGGWGPWYAQVDYARQNANTPLNGAPRAYWQGWKVGGSWGYMPGSRIGLIWVYNATNNAVGNLAGDGVYQSGWTVNWEQTFGNFQVMAQYGWTNNMKDCDSTAIIQCGDTKSTGYMVGGRYFLSKRT
ncbi:MAG TPA: porin, partial [Burkholderiales bacterium]|nr:porin [Burkholderiales bacterium]